MGNLFTRLFGGILFALFLSGVAVAETIPATVGPYEPVVTQWSNPYGITAAYKSTPLATCQATADAYIGPNTGATSSMITKIQYSCSAVRTSNGQTYNMGPLNAKMPVCNGSDVFNSSTQMCSGYSCPTGQGWTLSGATCTRPDCAAGQTRQPDGTCKNPCEGKDQLPPTFAWISYNKGASPYGIKCDNGCKVWQTGPVSHPTMNPTGETYIGGSHDIHALMKTAYTNEQCTLGQDGATAPNTPTPAPDIPPDRDKPPCDAGEGVMTSSSGKVGCVPAGTVDASTPQVGTTTSTVTHPDGSTTTTTTTTTRDPTTGATSTTTTITNTPGPGGGTQSGEPGTTTGTSDSNGGGGNGNGDGEEDGSDFCAKHPDSIVCKNNTFSGSCTEGESAPSCEGDAALCATAKAAFELKCGALGKKGTEYGQKLIEGQDDMAQSLPDPKNPDQHNVGSLNYSDGGGSCPPDLIFNVMGRSTTISMAEVCTIGGWLGNIGVALSLLIGGFIVIGAIRS